MTQATLPTSAEPKIIPDILQRFPFTYLSPRVCRECRAIVACITKARSIGRTRADIRTLDGCVFRTRNDLHPLTLMVFEWCKISITEKTFPAAASAAMGYETPAVTILLAEWVEPE